MDISGLVLTVLGTSLALASELYNYAQQVKGARRDIQALSNELFGLVGALEHFKLQQERIVEESPTSLEPPQYSEKYSPGNSVGQPANDVPMLEGRKVNVRSVLNQTLDFLKELQGVLAKPKGKFHAAVQLLKWPLTKDDMQMHLKRLERVKTYFILSLVTNEADQTQRIVDDIASLRTLVQETSEKQNAMQSPGAGKSFLVTAAIKDLLAAEPARDDLAYFYCSFSNEQSLHPVTILGSLLAQVCATTDPVYGELESMYENMSKNGVSKARKPEINDIVKLLVEKADSQGKLYVIVDGVNECWDPSELLRALRALLGSSARVRILLSSINEKEIESGLKEMPNLAVKSLQPWDIEDDITLLVYSNLESHPRLKQLSSSLKEEVMSALANGAQGMFRWVQCQLDLLSRLRTPGAVRKALKSLPPTLDQTYEEILGRVDGEEDRALTKQILEVLAFTLQPLTLSDVCEILQVTPGMPTLDTSKCLTHPKDILSICGSLLNYREETDVVTLAHHSVKSYLVSSLRGNASYFQLNEREGHRSMALYCLTYLTFDCFSFNSADPRIRGSGLYPYSGFGLYAVWNWALHAKEAEPLGEPLWSVLKSFLLSGESGRHNFENWVRRLLPGSRHARTTQPLYFAASFGLTTVAKYLLDMGADPEVRGGRGGATPINIAAYRGNLEVVELLLERGADPLAQDEPGLNAVQWAEYRRNSNVVDFFKRKGYRSQGARRRYGNIVVSSDESSMGL